MSDCLTSTNKLDISTVRKRFRKLYEDYNVRISVTINASRDQHPRSCDEVDKRNFNIVKSWKLHSFFELDCGSMIKLKFHLVIR